MGERAGLSLRGRGKLGLHMSQPPKQNCADDNDKQNSQLHVPSPRLASAWRFCFACRPAVVTEFGAVFLGVRHRLEPRPVHTGGQPRYKNLSSRIGIKGQVHEKRLVSTLRTGLAWANVTIDSNATEAAVALKNVPVMKLIVFWVIPSDRGHRNEQRFPLFSI